MLLFHDYHCTKLKLALEKVFQIKKQVLKLTKKMVYRMLSLRTILAAGPRIGRVRFF